MHYAAGWGRIVTMSPPITLGKMGGFTAYNISKFGMTMVALGVAQEYAGKGIGNKKQTIKIVGRLTLILIHFISQKNQLTASHRNIHVTAQPTCTRDLRHHRQQPVARYCGGEPGPYVIGCADIYGYYSQTRTVLLWRGKHRVWCLVLLL